MPTSYRVHVVPRLRRLGAALLIRDWLAITIGPDIWTWRLLTGAELAHELEHVRQWDQHGLLYVPRYARASWHAARAGGHWYRDNAFEVAARDAAERV